MKYVKSMALAAAVAFMALAVAVGPQSGFQGTHPTSGSGNGPHFQGTHPTSGSGNGPHFQGTHPTSGSGNGGGHV